MATQFAVETVDDSGQVRGNVSLALDTSGTPHIAYTIIHPEIGLGIVMLARRGVDGVWSREELSAVALAEDGDRVCLAIDSQGDPHLGYRDRESGGLIYGVKKEGTWKLEQVPENVLFPPGVMHPSLQLHPGLSDAALRDTPNFAFHHLSPQDLKHATKVGGRWKVTKVDSHSIRTVGLFPSLVFSPDEVLRIAYFDTLDSRSFLKLAVLLTRPEFDPEQGVELPPGWHPRVRDTDIQGFFVSMASPPGRILIAYYDNLSKSLKAWVQGRIPEGPVELPGQKEVIADRFSQFARTSAADRLAQEPFGDGKQTFRVAYADLDDGQLKFATRNRSDQPWSIETVDNIDGQGALPSLAYDKPRVISGRFESTAHLAYVGQGRRLKYATATE